MLVERAKIQASSLTQRLKHATYAYLCVCVSATTTKSRDNASETAFVRARVCRQTEFTTQTDRHNRFTQMCYDAQMAASYPSSSRSLFHALVSKEHDDDDDDATQCHQRVTLQRARARGASSACCERKRKWYASSAAMPIMILLLFTHAKMQTLPFHSIRVIRIITATIIMAHIMRAAVKLCYCTVCRHTFTQSALTTTVMYDRSYSFLLLRSTTAHAQASSSCTQFVVTISVVGQ